MDGAVGVVLDAGLPADTGANLHLWQGRQAVSDHAAQAVGRHIFARTLAVVIVNTYIGVAGEQVEPWRHFAGRLQLYAVALEVARSVNLLNPVESGIHGHVALLGLEQRSGQVQALVHHAAFYPHFHALAFQWVEQLAVGTDHVVLRVVDLGPAAVDAPCLVQVVDQAGVGRDFAVGARGVF